MSYAISIPDFETLTDCVRKRCLKPGHKKVTEIYNGHTLVNNFLLSLEEDDFLKVKLQKIPPNSSINGDKYKDFHELALKFVQDFFCADAKLDETANFDNLSKLKTEDFEKAIEILNKLKSNLKTFNNLTPMTFPELKAIVKKLIYFINKKEKKLQLDTIIACYPGLKLNSKPQYSTNAKLRICSPEQLAVLKLLFSIHNDKKLMYNYEKSPKAFYAMSKFVEHYFGSNIERNFSINLNVDDVALAQIFDDLCDLISPPPSKRQKWICALTILVALLNFSYVIYDSNSTCKTSDESTCRGRYRGTYFTFSTLVTFNSIVGAFGAFELRPYYKKPLNWAIFGLTILSGLFIIPLIVFFSGNWFEFAVSLLVPGLLSLINLTVLFR